MNKKGLSYPSLSAIVILIFVVMALALAQSGYSPSEVIATFDKINTTQITKNVSISIQQANTPDKPYYMQVIFNSIDKAVDFMMYTTFEVSKIAVRFAAENPNIINARILMGLVILALIAPLIYPLFIVIVSLFLIIKEWYQNRKYKLNLEKYKEVKDEYTKNK